MTKPLPAYATPVPTVHTVAALRYTPLLDVMAGKAKTTRCQAARAQSKASKASKAPLPATRPLCQGLCRG